MAQTLATVQKIKQKQVFSSIVEKDCIKQSMKRKGNLYQQIISMENLRLADKRAMKGKLDQPGVISHLKLQSSITMTDTSSPNKQFNYENQFTHMTQIIIGKCPSKSNCYKVIQLGKHASLAKTKALTDYEKSFYLQCNIYRNKNITGLFEIHLHVYYDSNRADLDNSLKIILDCLQKVNAIKNDNNCVKVIAEKFIDKIKPRIEFTLKPI